MALSRTLRPHVSGPFVRAIGLAILADGIAINYSAFQVWGHDFAPHYAAANVLAFSRLSRDGKRLVVCACNFSPVVREGYRLGLPHAGRWVEVLNTDSGFYGGSGVGNLGGVMAEEGGWHDLPASASVTLPPLGVVWLVPEDQQ